MLFARAHTKKKKKESDEKFKTLKHYHLKVELP